MTQLEATPQAILEINERYYGQPALFLEEILGMELDDWQRELCDNFHAHDRFAISSGHSSGKALSVSSIIPTPTGKRAMGELVVGDQVYGSDGCPTTVLAVYPQGRRPMYRVTMSDHTYAMADGGHLWQVSSRQTRRNCRPDIILTTDDLAKRGAWRKNGKAMARVFRLPRHSAVKGDGWGTKFAYALGVWLGDGKVGAASYDKPYTEVAEHIGECGIDITLRSDRKTRTIHGLVDLLNEYGLKNRRSYERFIPENFFNATINTRLELLRGLLDTDGECDKGGHVVFSSTSIALANGVAEIVRSLGGKASLNPTAKLGRYKDKNGANKDCRYCYRVSLSMPDDCFPLFYIEHKHKRVKTPGRESLYRYIESIDYSHDEDAVCITVDAADSLYLANDYIVTHNTALTAGLIQYFIAVHPDPQVIVTANTQQQLREKTWRELAKWHQKSLLKDWFKWTATQFSFLGSPETWFASAVPNTAHSAENFAGAHEKYMLMIFDEASAIEREIWEVAEGATATEGGYRKWLVFGNPTRIDGAFHDCFHGQRHRWQTMTLDTRLCKYADQSQIAQWAEDYGEDSDFFRVRVRGEFPRQAVTQLIGVGAVKEAAERIIMSDTYLHAPQVLGVDVARFGTDSSVITLRQGLKLHWQRAYHGLDTMAFSSLIAEAINETKADATFIDEGAMGAGVIDRLVQLGFRSVYGINFGAQQGIDQGMANKRAEMWCKMRDWLEYAQITKDRELHDDLTGPEYGYDLKERILLEKKSDMKKRGLASPDKGDSLALTFAMSVQPKSQSRDAMPKWKQRVMRGRVSAQAA